VAEYVETTRNQRNEMASAVKRGRHTPLRELLAIPSLLMSPDKSVETAGGTDARDHYQEAGLLIEFLRESDFGQKGFADFVQGIGTTPNNDLERISAVLQRVYDVSIEELDQEFQRYCRAR
jgi:hypothetical protein